MTENTNKKSFEKEIAELDASNPFTTDTSKMGNVHNDNPVETQAVAENYPRKQVDKLVTRPAFKMDNDTKNYFSAFLSTNLKGVALKILGLREVIVENHSTGQSKKEYQKAEDHCLSDKGSQMLLSFLESHTSGGAKLSIRSEDKYNETMLNLTRNLISYVQKNLFALGADTKQKQSEVIHLITIIIQECENTYTRSIKGTENKRAYGELDFKPEFGVASRDKSNDFRIEDLNNGTQ